jgi:uncharacterized protein YutE (UPF0331/DUF86 family)
MNSVRAKIVASRAQRIKQMLGQIRNLPLSSLQDFVADVRNVAAAESFLRRSLEALLDVGRHILAKGLGEAVTEYKEIAVVLTKRAVLSEEEGRLLQRLAGYRNRMVHFYHEITEKELYQICSQELSDIEALLNAILKWIKDHPDMIDHSL